MSHVLYHKDGAVGVVTLSKPPHNLIDEALLDGLLSGYDRAIAEGCRAILLRSAMRHFCAGADVAGFAGGGRRRDQAGLENLLDALENVSLPTVALRGIKTLANLSVRHGIAGADAKQTEVNNLMWASEDQKRGLAAFVATGPGSAVFEGN